MITRPMFNRSPHILNEQLLLAAQRGNIEDARELLALGADPSAREPFCGPGQGTRTLHSERTVLMHATQSYRAPEMVTLLLEAGADVHASDTKGWNAIRVAFGSTWSEVVRLLLAAGAEVTPEKTPHFLAAAAGAADAEMVRFALDVGYNPSGETGKGGPLVNALRSVQHQLEPPPEATKCVELLLSVGASVDALGYDDEPLVVSAAKSYHFRILQALLKAGADPDVRDAHQWTASMVLAGYYGSDAHRAAPLLKLLFEHGARSDVADKDGIPLLHLAARGNDETGLMCRLVVEAGAPVESRDAQGQTALMSAAKRGRSASTRVLLEAGAELEARDDKGWTSLMHAVWIEPRMTHEANIVPPPTHFAWQTSAGSEMRDQSERNQKQRTAMREAAQILLDAGADPLAQTDDGQTVLQLAASDPIDGALQLIQNAVSTIG